MSSTETVIARIDALRDAQTAFLAELVKTPSDNPPGDCAAHAEVAAKALEALGFEVERHPVPAATVRAAGMISATNLIVRRRFGPGPTLALNAHGDVVPPGEGWTADPYGAEIRDGVMYGRGVAVSKSDFATYAFALKALIETEAPLNGTVELHLTYDEETGGLVGPGWILEQGLSKPDLAISAGFSYNVVVAHNGCLHLEVEVKGRSAHAARPDTGVDALEAATSLLSKLYALRETYKATVSAVDGIESPTLVVGLIEGGINTNVVPDLVRFRIDRRMIPDESPEAAERDLTAFIEQAGAELPGVEVTVRRILLARPLQPLPGQERLVDTIRTRAREILGEDIPANGVPIYTDARLYTGVGVPTVLYGAGPRSLLEANGHRADEKLVLDDLNKATKVVALAIADLLA
ncbi:M20/M25/M40 family metallo-hydrolase [Methylopila turkensis]|uniref:Succinyl-diaminopimelate desuccinylase n=1 Tax=Methylopila turkensis TaxID=1437816 RepID=A0A9W6N7G9_9HYPH|nr:M20/M25/M40 family metallo-hydrolase [Methylopila turkensis]GLK80533.1 succinyl-diaminopimelate desuccinylase [Methylopila turkensis]